MKSKIVDSSKTYSNKLLNVRTVKFRSFIIRKKELCQFLFLWFTIMIFHENINDPKEMWEIIKWATNDSTCNKNEIKSISDKKQENQ